MADLIEHLFAPAFDNEWLGQMGDATAIRPVRPSVTRIPSGQLAFTPIHSWSARCSSPAGISANWPVYGTVNDLAMRGAKPLYLSAGFILEEGLPMETLGNIVTAMAAACKKAGVKIATGDTKVVQKGHGDGIVHQHLRASASSRRAWTSARRTPDPATWCWSAGRWATTGSRSCRCGKG